MNEITYREILGIQLYLSLYYSFSLRSRCPPSSSFCYSTRKTDQVSHPYEIRGKSTSFVFQSLDFIHGYLHDDRLLTEWQPAFSTYSRNFFLNATFIFLLSFPTVWTSPYFPINEKFPRTLKFTSSLCEGG